MGPEEVLKALRERGGCARLPELAAATGQSVFSLLTALNELVASGAVARGRTGDPLNPLSTTEWCLQERRGAEYAGALGVVEALVVTPPLARDVGGVLASYGVPVVSPQEILRDALCNASKYFKLGVPYVDQTLHVLFTEKCISPSVVYKILITRQAEERMRKAKKLLDDIRGYLPNVEYKVVDGERGLHAKFLVVDGEYAAVFTFNLYYTHFIRNYDIGVVLRGPVVGLIDRIFDYLWERAK